VSKSPLYLGMAFAFGICRPLAASPGADRAALVAVPTTPAGRAFSAWLTAFDAADRDRLQAVFKQFREPRPVEGALSFRQMTGGFDLKKVLESTPTRIRVWLQERNRLQIAEAEMEVEPQPPHQVVRWDLHAVPAPDELLNPEQRARNSVDRARRDRLIDEIARKISAHYVLPNVGQKMIVALREHAARGDYDKIIQAGVLSATMTKDLREVSHDRHLRVDFSLEPPRMLQQRPRDERLAEMRARNFEFGAIERLPGNVAHLVINGFLPAKDDEVRQGIAALMSQVADADALLIDLRENHGGDPATVALVASYLFDSTPVHLNDMYRRDNDSTTQFWTLRDLPGKRFGSRKPVYVLTSKSTFSGGEELAYDLQSLRRALVIGETTGGGAHPIAPHDLGDGFTILLPWGRPINPVTKTNWEQVGVDPDVKVPAPAALEEARSRAQRDIAARKSGADNGGQPAAGGPPARR
jgi:hypothetical protein